MDTDSEYIQHSGEHGPNPERYWHLAGTLTFKNSIIHFCHASCFKMVGNVQNSVNSMSIVLLLHFFCCEVSSLIRSNAVCNTLLVDKTFCSFGKSFAFREDVSVSTVSVYSNKDKTLPLP